MAVTATQNTSSPGCGNYDAVFSNGVSPRNISDRSYLISIPANYSSQTLSPLILSFHGVFQSAEVQLELDQFSNAKVNEQYIVVYPNALDGQWQVSPESDSDDVGFVSSILEEVESSLCIDLSRIYATGMSQGGGMTGYLACNQTISSRFAAFAPVSGAFYVQDTNHCDTETIAIPCSPGRAKVPILEFHGGSDDVIPYNGDPSKRGACLPAIPHWVQAMVELNNLGSSNASTSLTSSATLYQFGGDEATPGLVSHVYDGISIGPVWPATEKFARTIGGNSSASFNATPMILDFFSKYSLHSDNGTDTSNSTDTGPASNSSSGNNGGTADGANGSPSSFAGYGHISIYGYLFGCYLIYAFL
ncbi:putative Alpha/Beta hydrolase protein [Seiridium unicorne]|uniref:feruloyl esterase n=1 Tax=Seiridium unicorne TaxID=138068 RepID=A0ABR2V045_9PEZI